VSLTYLATVNAVSHAVNIVSGPDAVRNGITPAFTIVTSVRSCTHCCFEDEICDPSSRVAWVGKTSCHRYSREKAKTILCTKAEIGVCYYTAALDAKLVCFLMCVCVCVRACVCVCVAAHVYLLH
jgi:hypothetical protein